MFQDPGSITNIQQPIMFANPSQNAFSGSTLHEASSKQFQISENKEQKVRPNIRHGNQVTDSLVEGLKRDIRIYIEKCSMLVTASKQNQQENQERARQRDEQLIDLEWKISEQQTVIDNLKEENAVLTSDCHRLLSKLEAIDQAVIEDNEFKEKAQKTQEDLKHEVR